MIAHAVVSEASAAAARRLEKFLAMLPGVGFVSVRVEPENPQNHRVVFGTDGELAEDVFQVYAKLYGAQFAGATATFDVKLYRGTVHARTAEEHPVPSS